MLRSFANSLPSNREKFQGQKVEKQLAKRYLLRRWELIRDKNLPVLIALFFVVTLLPGGLGGLSHSDPVVLQQQEKQETVSQTQVEVPI